MENDANRQTFNVGTGTGISMQALAEKVAELTDYKEKIVEGYPPGYPRRPASADPPYLVVDPSKIKAKIGYRTIITLEDGLRKMIEYFSKRREPSIRPQAC
jgi:nucleoside-diphosphate-sugar epimerase